MLDFRMECLLCEFHHVFNTVTCTVTSEPFATVAGGNFKGYGGANHGSCWWNHDIHNLP